MGPHKRETKLDKEGHKGFLEKEMFQRKNILDRGKITCKSRGKAQISVYQRTESSSMTVAQRSQAARERQICEVHRDQLLKGIMGLFKEGGFS